jgi:hypothetical protein
MLYLRLFSASHLQLGPVKQFQICELILNKHHFIQATSHASNLDMLTERKMQSMYVHKKV